MEGEWIKNKMERYQKKGLEEVYIKGKDYEIKGRISYIRLRKWKDKEMERGSITFSKDEKRSNLKKKRENADMSNYHKIWINRRVKWEENQKICINPTQVDENINQ